MKAGSVKQHIKIEVILATAGIEKCFEHRARRVSGAGSVFLGHWHTPSIKSSLLLPSIPQALLECVRLRTFSKYGLQQMQVDAHYLQIYLWRFVSDEQ